MNPIDVAVAVVEARETKRLLRFRSPDVWFTPDEVTDALKNGETWPLTTPFAIEPRPHPGMPLPLQGPPEAQPRTGAPSAPFLDLIYGALALFAIGVLFGLMVNPADLRVLDRLMGWV